MEIETILGKLETYCIKRYDKASPEIPSDLLEVITKVNDDVKSLYKHHSVLEIMLMYNIELYYYNVFAHTFRYRFWEHINYTINYLHSNERNKSEEELRASIFVIAMFYTNSFVRFAYMNKTIDFNEYKESEYAFSKYLLDKIKIILGETSHIPYHKINAIAERAITNTNYEFRFHLPKNF